MNVDLIEMPAEVAADDLKKYRASLHRRADAEYQAIADGLVELAKGTPLLQLSRVFGQFCPRDEKGRPRLAIARADRLRVRYDNWGGGNWQHSFNSAYYQRGRAPGDCWITVPGSQVSAGHVSGFALVPIVPPEHRRGHDLSKHFVLWEVERWAENAREVGPDIDPFLLRRISADLYAVVAQWDLSPIEQAILAGRRTL